MATLLERFLRHTSKPDGNCGCWLWTGCIQKGSANGGGGYGKMGSGGRAQRKTLLAHRVAYELFRGDIPSGMEIDHTCHDPEACPGGSACSHRRCVNPSHMKLVSHAANMQRVNRTNVIKAATLRSINQTHCLRGHEFNEKNTYIDRRLRRHCRLCQLIRQRVGRAA